MHWAKRPLGSLQRNMTCVSSHDTLRAEHDKDFRTFAAFPLAELADKVVVITRLDAMGNFKYEAILGIKADERTARCLRLLLYKRHTRVWSQSPINLAHLGTS